MAIESIAGWRGEPFERTASVVDTQKRRHGGAPLWVYMLMAASAPLSGVAIVLMW